MHDLDRLVLSWRGEQRFITKGGLRQEQVEMAMIAAATFCGRMGMIEPTCLAVEVDSIAGGIMDGLGVCLRRVEEDAFDQRTARRCHLPAQCNERSDLLTAIIRPLFGGGTAARAGLSHSAASQRCARGIGRATARRSGATRPALPARPAPAASGKGRRCQREATGDCEESGKFHF